MNSVKKDGLSAAMPFEFDQKYSFIFDVTYNLIILEIALRLDVYTLCIS